MAQLKTEKFSLSMAFGGTNYFNLGKTPQFNIRVQIKANSNGDAVFFNLSHETPYQLNYKTEAVAVENGTIPSLIYVAYNIEYIYNNITANYLYNLTDYDDEESDKNKNYYYYLFGGVGVGYIENKYLLNEFDNLKYRIFYTDIIKDQEYIGINADFGFGANYNINRFKIYGEGKLSLIQTFLKEKIEPTN
ncbi:MAG: hypothetical protein K9G64_07130 [Bacteroidia bacterium]|nr:hypothetical protein [Bacteroidia bacterium]